MNKSEIKHAAENLHMRNHDNKRIRNSIGLASFPKSFGTNVDGQWAQRVPP